MTKRSSKIAKKVISLREKLWPELTEEELWHHREYDGFTSIPRTMPIIMNIIDDLTKGKPASSTYLSLWCKAFGEMYVSLQNSEDLAFHSGFAGQRAARTWQDRMNCLADLGFIKVAAGPRGGLSHAVIPNPHLVIRRLHRDRHPGLTQAAFNTLVERANDIGAKDMEIELPEEKRAREAELADENLF